MEQFLNTETLVIELLLVASLVAIAVRRIRIPYTVSLVVVGLVITSQQATKFTLTPELILVLFVPPLVFEAAFHLEFSRLRENLVPILVLAVPGVVLTTLIVGLLVSTGTKLPLSTCLVFGALISATDPVAVVALFRSLGAPKKLTVMVEGESLFNDGTSIVIFNLMVAVALPVGLATTGEHGSAGAADFDLIKGILDFLVVGGGGLGIGVGLGWLVSQLIARIDDYLIETTLTTVLAFGSYLVAERLHMSGVLAVVGAGIICGNLGLRGMSPTTRIVLFNFWEYLAFVANSLVFLLIGLDVNITQIISQIGPIGIGVVAVIISRAVVVYGLAGLLNIFRVHRPHNKNQSSQEISANSSKISLAYQHVLMWGGLRGAVSLALVLSLPASFTDRELLKVMAYGVVLFTLLGQGTTMQWLLKRLGLIRQDETTLEHERSYGRLLVARAGQARVAELHQAGIISTEAWQELAPKLNQEVQAQTQARQELLELKPELGALEQENALLETLRAKRATLTTLNSNGVISEAVYEELLAEIDAGLQGQHSHKPAKES